MLDIEIKTIPHQEHRYPTVGDYWDEGSKEVFRVSELEDWRYEFLIAFHELTEKALCRVKGISVADIDAFDIEYEKGRVPDDKESEPGNDPSAPYYREHQLAMGLERTMAALLDVDWIVYEKCWKGMP